MRKEITFVDLYPPRETFLQDVIWGLSQPQKSLSPKYLYDEKGAELFTQICGVEEYYPTRTEMHILESCAEHLNDILLSDVSIIELGSGGNRKISKLLSHTKKVQAYVPIDIARQQLINSAVELKHAYPLLEIIAVCGDYTERLPMTRLVPENYEQQLVFFPGSTLGNLDLGDALHLMQKIRSYLRRGDCFLLGVDLLKDIALLEAAYNDSQGVTAQFNLNLLHRMNRELQANFQVNRFQHQAIFNPEHERIEMHVVSLADQMVHIQGDDFDFAAGETIHTESSHKFTPEKIQYLADASEFAVAEVWTDPRDYFAEVLLKAA